MSGLCGSLWVSMGGLCRSPRVSIGGGGEN